MIRTTLGSPDIGLRSKDIHCAFEVDKTVHDKISTDGGEAAHTTAGGDDFLTHPLIFPLKPRNFLVSS